MEARRDDHFDRLRQADCAQLVAVDGDFILALLPAHCPEPRRERLHALCEGVESARGAALSNGAQNLANLLVRGSARQDVCEPGESRLSRLLCDAQAAPNAFHIHALVLQKAQHHSRAAIDRRKAESSLPVAVPLVDLARTVTEEHVHHCLVSCLARGHQRSKAILPSTVWVGAIAQVLHDLV